MIPAQYRKLVRDPRTRRLLAGLGVSALGDGMSTVTIAWLAVLIAPPANAGAYVGVVISAYTLPGVVGALTFGRFAAALRLRGAAGWLLTPGGLG